MKTLLSLKFVTLMLATFLLSLDAKAETGWIKGKWQFWQKNGNFCPATRAPCTGANYTWAEFDKKQALKNIQVFIQNDTAGIIGSGITNTAGDFNIQWSYSGTLPNKSHTRIWVRPWYAGNRYMVNNANGTYPNNWTGYFTIVAGTTSGSPQNVGSSCVGTCTSASPDPYYNVYWAAEMEWRLRLQTYMGFYYNMTNTEIRGFANTMPGFKSTTGSCPTSCAGADNKIQLDANAGFSPQSRIMHEYGHVASQYAKFWTSTLLCYGTDQQWTMSQYESACASFEEGLATFVADSTLYTHLANQPHTCLAAAFAPCGTGTFNVEASEGSSCDEGMANWPITEVRFLWDVYDSGNDGETITEGANGNWYRFFNVLSQYPTGTGTNQHDEHWNSTYTALDPATGNGRGAVSFAANYLARAPLNISSARTINCSAQ